MFNKNVNKGEGNKEEEEKGGEGKREKAAEQEEEEGDRLQEAEKRKICRDI